MKTSVIAQRVAQRHLEALKNPAHDFSNLSGEEREKIETLLKKVGIPVSVSKAKKVVDKFRSEQPTVVDKLINEVAAVIGRKTAGELPLAKYRLRGVADDDELLSSVLTLVLKDPEFLMKYHKASESEEK